MKNIILIWLLIQSFAVVAQKSDSLVQEGIRLHDSGKYLEAIEKYKQALELDPKSYLINYEIAFSYSALKQYEEALRYSDVSLLYATNETKLHPLILKGSALDDLGRTAESVAFYKDALKEFPEHYLLLFNYAISASRLGKIDDAEQALVKALGNNPNHPGSHLQLAKINLDKNLKSKAALGMFFFLMLENTSQRSEENAPVLKQLFYGQGHKKDSARVFTITLPDSKKDPEWASAELFFSFMGLASTEIDKVLKDKNSIRTEQQKFVSDSERFFNTMKELRDKKKKPKKKKSVESTDIWWDLYVPFFSDVVKDNHIEAFCYHVMASSGDAEIQNWLEMNNEKLEYFYLWVNANR
jgi:tetratricopeptide (TPR) repeat protein